MRVNKTRNIKVRIYTIDEACERLAVLSNHKRSHYSRGGLYKVIAKYKPELLEPVITEDDLVYLSKKIHKPGRPKIVDKNQ